MTPSVVDLYDRASVVATSELSVLILGESGTGKEILARYLHQASHRAAKSFVAMNCAALPKDLLEAELFGIEKGAATGVRARPGRFEQAHGGTLFLDEIGDMALETQAKILRVLQEKEVVRVGGTEAQPADARILAATHQNIDEMIADGRFRRDLYYRLGGWQADLPPLRQRQPDISNLAAYFLEQESLHRGAQIAGISRAALSVLESYSWPGNIRQLQQTVQRCSLFVSPGELLTASHLDASLRGEEPVTSLAQRMERHEKIEIENILAQMEGSVAKAAEVLGINRATLYRRMQALGLKRD